MMKRRLLFLDVDGVLHPLGANHLPLNASVEDLAARADEDTAADDDDPQHVSRVCAGEFEPGNMIQLARIVRAARQNVAMSTN